MRGYRKSFFKWLIISLLFAYFGFMVGKFKQDILYNSIHLLELDAASLNAENQELTQQLSLIQADFVAEKQVNETLVVENKTLNQALDASNNKLYFYEQVVAPGLSVSGLNVYSFTVIQAAEKNHWSYELVLMQTQTGRHVLTGNVDITFAGADDSEGTAKPIKLSELDKDFSGAFKFKYFQTLKGEFVLPKKAKVEQIFVSADAKGSRWSRSQRVEKIYDWKDFIENGGSSLKELETQEESE